jgi:hypothetical protein
VDRDSQRFIDALRALEAGGAADGEALDGIAALFSSDARLSNPRTPAPLRGRDGARRFWQEYRAAFGEVRSEFRSVTESAAGSDRRAVLEWESAGTLQPEDRPIRYQGVSVVEWTGEAISRFAAYFDPSPLTAAAPPAQATPDGPAIPAAVAAADRRDQEGAETDAAAQRAGEADTVTTDSMDSMAASDPPAWPRSRS